MEIKRGVMERVRKKEAYLRNLNRCLAVNICPKCGDNLRCVPDDFGKEYTCLSATCAFTYAK